ncbi:acyltransferase [Psychromonas sp. CD1]|uniref:acyltransferase n=1 Tax=Psychromonas sp. CD1 TaxID=1979839 RepID=UPI000B9B74E2|nr:acyltransferase [Psychromonas sp. CD1]
MLKLLKLKLRNKVELKGKNTIILGENIRVRYCDISLRGNNNKLILSDGVNLKRVCIEITGSNCLIYIGKHCIIGENTYLSSRGSSTHLSIGNYCMFSRNVKLMTSDGHDITKNNKIINPNASITIGHRVWLADSCVILKGNDIQDNAIIGINAVVTKNVKANSIVAGNPAKMIGQDITWREELTE